MSDMVMNLGNFMDDLGPYVRDCTFAMCTRHERSGAQNCHESALPMARIEGSKPKTMSPTVVHTKHLHVQMARLQTDNGPVGYFSLRGEIRNQIMQYALIPGTVNVIGAVPRKLTILESYVELVHLTLDRIFEPATGFANFLQEIPEMLLRQLFAFYPSLRPSLWLLAQIYTLILDEDSDDGHVGVPRNPTILASWYELTATCVKHISGRLLQRVSNWVLGRERRQVLQLPRTSSPRTPNHALRPVPQLLATCKIAYLEGHNWFYSRNTFYLPRGPL